MTVILVHSFFQFVMSGDRANSHSSRESSSSSSLSEEIQRNSNRRGRKRATTKQKTPGKSSKRTKTDNLQDQFEDFKKYFDNKLSSLKSGALEALNRESVDKLNLTKLKRNGNIQQFKFNLEIKAKIENIASETKDKKTFKHLKGVIRSIDKQNKLIRLADKSEVGWLMVNEYVADDLASDSGDDAKIRKAEKRAKEKIDKKRRQQIYRSSQPRSASANPVQPGIPSSYMQYPNNGQGGVPYGQQPARRPTFRPFREFPDGPCFSCGGSGHWRSQCPAKFNFTKQQPFRPYVNPQFFNRAMQGNVQEQEKTGQP